jgi:hypothetical protein
MRSSTPKKDSASARETVHELLNALAAARMWLTILDGAQPTKRPAQVADALARLGASIDNADDCCQRLRQILPTASPRRRK